MIKNKYLKSFLALDHFADLFHAFQLGLNKPLSNISYLQSSTALLVGFFPLIGFYLEYIKNYPSNTGLYFLGLAAIISALNQKSFLKQKSSIKKDLRLVHSAFAIGAVPLLLTLLFFPALMPRMDDLKNVSTHVAERPEYFKILPLIIQISLTAAVFEELVYRGMVLPAIRRLAFTGKPFIRDLIAILITSAIFAAAHIPVWGVKAAFPVFCVGIGFGIGGVCTQERILALMIYHFIFDILSFSCLFIGIKFY